MSTLSKNVTAKRIASLAATGVTLFHTADLALLFGIRNPNTLRVTISRYLRSGLLYRVHRGLYSLRTPQEIDPVTLGAACLHRYCYLSTETVLASEGFILQNIDATTFVSGVSRRFTMSGHRYVSRRLKSEFLHHPAGISMVNGVLTASPLRALADLLSFDPHYHIDHPVPWDELRTLQQTIGYPLTPNRYVDSARA
ncbi:MAG: type IV toxin-antitoxin system AbiEi family antitoxin domain-containing protein [Candidatus Peribacteraceae bacterium]|nr:type IV toxin-antitoxin system AbiEi family antitoxin domain-containing protein [Candidatus Peribacteraceae bacterium]